MANRVGQAKIVLRLGLAGVFVYAAIASLMAPGDWIVYLPPFLTKVMNPAVLLKFFSAYELALAIWLISGKYLRYSALLTAATMAGIVLSDPDLFSITFRDLAIGASALALALLADNREP